MSKVLAEGTNWVMKGTKETVVVVTKMGETAVSVIHHATGPGRVAVKTAGKVISWILPK